MSVNKKNQKQVSLAGAAMAPKAAQKRADKKSRRVVVLIAAAAVVLCVVAGVFLFGGKEEGPTLSGREFAAYRYTPDDALSDVSYYALGIAGEQLTDTLDMMALVCFDRRQETVSVLQLPVATYVDDATRFATQTAGNVWAVPKGITWCPTCRGEVAADALDGEIHIPCGTKTETRAGSSAGSFAQYFNTQLGLPVDNYLVIPRAGLSTLIDAVGGVTLKLEKSLQYEGVDYAAGEGTLPGSAAVYYATQWEYDGSPSSDLGRMERQRQLLAALVSRLSNYKLQELYNNDPTKKDVLSNVMAGRNPIRMDTTDFGKARLLGKSSDSSAANVKYTEALARFVRDICGVPMDKITCSILPGESTKKGAATVYSAHRTATLELLKEQMNPAALLEEDAVGIKEIAGKGQSDPKTATLDTLLIKQAVQQTETTTTTAASSQEEGAEE